MAVPRHIIAIGGSAGALDPLIEILGKVSPDLDMAYFVVIHFPSNRTSILPALLNRTTRLRAVYAKDGEKIERGHVYVARSDRHLIVNDGRVGVINGPKENASRPSIDVLFRSVAQAAGRRAMGVVLSGLLDDGTAGLLSIAKQGGRTVAQEPEEALFAEMPRNAIITGKAGSVLSASAIAAYLEEVGNAQDTRSNGAVGKNARPDLDTNGMPDDEPFGVPSPFVCPECQGTLWQLRDDTLERYRCRVGHAYSEQTLWEQKSESLEAALWAAARALKEQADLSERIAENARSQSKNFLAKRFEQKHRAAQEAEATVRDVLLGLRPNEGPDIDPAMKGQVQEPSQRA